MKRFHDKPFMMNDISMLWFKFSFGGKFLKPVQFLFSFVVYSLAYSGTMANKTETNSKNFKPRINLNHNIYAYNVKYYFMYNLELHAEVNFQCMILSSNT